MSTFRYINIDLIAPNPKRNFTIFPIEQEQVKTLMASYERSGDFGVIPIRPSSHISEYEDGYTFEQASGHHRIEAMRQLGWETVPCRVSDLDEDTMISIMIDENMTQHGNKTAARLDSISTVIKRIAEVILSLNIEEMPTSLSNSDRDAWRKKQDKRITPQVSAMLESFGELTAKQLKDAHGAILSGKGFSWTLIDLYKPKTFGPKSTIAESVGQLRDTGILATIFSEVAEGWALKVEAEREEAEALEVEIEAERVRQAKAEQKAIKEAEKARKERLAAQKREKLAKNKADALQAKREAAEAEKNARNAAARAKAAAKQQAEIKAKEDARQASEQAQRKAIEAARTAAKAAKAAAKGLHPDVLTLLVKPLHVAEVRRMVSGRPDIFPEHEQPGHIKEMMESLELVGEEVTVRTIRSWFGNIFATRDALFRKLREDSLAADEISSIVFAVDNAIAGVRQRATDFRRACVKLDAVLNDPRQGERAYRDVMGDRRLRHELETASRALTSILDGLGQQTSIRTIETKDFIEG